MKALLVFALCLGCAGAAAQSSPDTCYQVEMTATASPTLSFFRSPRFSGGQSEASVGYGASLRLLWHPGRLLSLGILTGYMNIAEDDIPPANPSDGGGYRARLAAVPILLGLTMQKYGVELGMGVGPYLMMTTVEGGGSSTARASRLELGMTFFAAYMFSLGADLQIGPEIRVVSFRYRGIISVMPSCSLRYIPLRY